VDLRASRFSRNMLQVVNHRPDDDLIFDTLQESVGKR
jgi:hypothetical protein